jgi:microcompartment protein CcmL/EutN
MREALGLVETRGLGSAILVADAMAKTANINIIGLENTKGLGYMTIKVCGDVGAVTAAVTCGKQLAIENSAFVSAKVIPRPSNGIEATFCQPNNKKGDSNLKEEDISKENLIIENNNTNNEESIVEKDTVINGDDTTEKKELLNNPRATVENLENKVEEASVEKEEAPIKQDSSQEKVSNSEKDKIRKSSRKKVETKKIEE